MVGRMAFVRSMLAVVFGLAAALLLVVPADCQESAARRGRPNIVFVFSDDHAAHAISAYGSRVNETPHIDSLARDGVLFANAFCGNAICGPSRATVLTGLHSHANGFRQNGDTFDGGQRTLPKMLRAAGYQTAIIGKWHLDTDPTGFDHWDVLPGQGAYYNPDFISAGGRRREQGYCTEVTTRLAIEWLEQRDPDRPFLLMCQHKAPHRSWQPGPRELELYRGVRFPEPPTLFDDYAGRGKAARAQEMEIDRHMYLAYDLMCPVGEDERYRRSHDAFLARLTKAQREQWDAAFGAENAAFRAAKLSGRDLVRWKYQRYLRNYLRCVAGVDRSVGELLQWLEEAGLADNTIVVYSSDQGFFLGDHGWYDKRWMYEESMRMPLLVRWPGVARAGHRCEELVQNIDFAPTLLDAAGVAVPADMHGVSALPLLRGESPEDWRQSVYYRYYEGQAEHNVGRHEGVRTTTHKLIWYSDPENAYWELFDLVADPDELRNVYGDSRYAEVVEELTAELARLKEQYGVEG